MKGRGQCYEVVTSASLLTIRKLMVKTPPTEVLVQTCQLVDRAGVKPPPQPLVKNDCRLLLLSWWSPQCLFIVFLSSCQLFLSSHVIMVSWLTEFITKDFDTRCSGTFYELNLIWLSRPTGSWLSNERKTKVSFEKFRHKLTNLRAH
jgi:hypothetical protein